MNPTTQLVEAIEQIPISIQLPSGKVMNLPNNVPSKSYTAAILLAIADAVDTQIGEDEDHWNVGPYQLDFAMSPEMEERHNRRIDSRNELRTEMRTFTAALRERAK